MTPQERNACKKREGDGVRSFFLPPTAKGWGLTPDGVCHINRGGTGAFSESDWVYPCGYPG